MRIEKVYKTSRGTFWNKAEAEKKINRAKTFGNRPGDPVEYEPVQEVFVLIVDVRTDQGVRGIGIESCAFELSKIELK